MEFNFCYETLILILDFLLVLLTLDKYFTPLGVKFYICNLHPFMQNFILYTH